MIKKIDYDSGSHYDSEGFYICYETKNPSFQPLPDYHFDRDEMNKVFDGDFMDWYWNVGYNNFNDEFILTSREDTHYIIHLKSGTIVSWYKHIGRCNTCNKPLTLDDLREFKKMLLESFDYEEV